MRNEIDNLGQGRPKLSQFQVIQLVSQLSGLTQKECRIVLDDYADVLRECCLNGVDVIIPHVGTLSNRYKPYKAPRPMFNVNTQQNYMTAERLEHNVPAFRMFPSLIDELREKSWGNPVFKPQGLDDISKEENYDEDEVEVDE